MRNAIECNEFGLHVQPKMKLDTGEVVGVESLVRRLHPVRGNVLRDEFIPFAEQTGFIRVLTGCVLEQSAARPLRSALPYAMRQHHQYHQLSKSGYHCR